MSDTGSRCSCGIQLVLSRLAVTQPAVSVQVRLNADDVIVCETRIDQGMKSKNPMDRVNFYQTRDAEARDKHFPITVQEVTNMFGSVFQVRTRPCRTSLVIVSPAADGMKPPLFKSVETVWSGRYVCFAGRGQHAMSVPPAQQPWGIMQCRTDAACCNYV